MTFSLISLRVDTNKNIDLKNIGFLSLTKKTKCDFLSNVISVDTKGNNYDLLMSYSTSDVNFN